MKTYMNLCCLLSIVFCPIMYSVSEPVVEEWKAAETLEARILQRQMLQEELLASRDLTRSLFSLAEGDEALLAANRKLDEYAKSIAEEARLTNGQAPLPGDFRQRRNAIIAEEQKALKAAMGADNYKTYNAELRKQQLLMRQLYVLRQLEKEEARQ